MRICLAGTARALTLGGSGVAHEVSHAIENRTINNGRVSGNCYISYECMDEDAESLPIFFCARNHSSVRIPECLVHRYLDVYQSSEHPASGRPFH